MSFLLYFLISLSWSIPKDASWKEQLDRSFAPENEFQSYISKYYSALKDAQHVNLKPQQDYKSVKTINLNTHKNEYQKHFANFLTEFYSFIDEKIDVNGHTAYFHKGSSDKLLVIIPVPHFGAPSDNSVLLKAVMKKFPKDSLLYVDNSADFFKKNTMTAQEVADQLSASLKKSYEKWQLQKKAQKNMYVLCFSTPYAVTTLASLPELYDRVVFYSPMIKEIAKGHLMNPRRIYKGEASFPLTHIMYSYFNILNGDKTVIPAYFMKRAQHLNVGTFANVFEVYEKGVPFKGLKNTYAILAEKDQIVPAANSASQLFTASYTIPGADHLDAVSMDAKVELHLNALERFNSLPLNK